MSFICTQSFCYFGDDASMLENGSAPQIPHLTRVYDLCFFFYGCAFAAGGQKLYCYSAFNSPNFCAGKALEAQGCGWITFKIRPLSPPVPGAGALESRNLSLFIGDDQAPAEAPGMIISSNWSSGCWFSLCGL